MHVASNFLDPLGNDTAYANHSMYFEQIGKHPERLKNLHFVYALAIRALNIVHDQLIEHDYTTGLCYEQDQLTQVYIMDLLSSTIGECWTSFNESTLFNKTNDISQQALLSEI